jgi:hypothetical protein
MDKRVVLHLCKTDQGVLVKLKDEPMEMKPRKTFNRLMDEAGAK